MTPEQYTGIGFLLIIILVSICHSIELKQIDKENEANKDKYYYGIKK